MPQSKKSTTPRIPVGRTSRGMSEGPKSMASAPKTTAQKPSTVRALYDKPMGADRRHTAVAKSNRARRSDSGA